MPQPARHVAKGKWGEPIKLNCIIYCRDLSSILPQGVIMHLYSMLIIVICNLIMTLIPSKIMII